MGIRLDKGEVIALYCYCRQAERSLDHALSGCGEPWRGLQEYYETGRREEVLALVKLLTNLGGDLRKVPARAAIAHMSFYSPMLFLVRRVANVWKSSWSFSRDEITFMLATMTRFLNVLETEEPDRLDERISLRMDLHACQRIIEDRSCGCRELRWANRVEHYLQPDFIEHVSLEQLGVAKKALVRN